MYIGVYCSTHKDQLLFTDVYDPKYCVKKIKNIDGYLSYIAYSELNYMLNEEFRIDEILSELIFKYKNRVEAYLKYWQLLVKGKYKNYKKAHSVSDLYWKMCRPINLDDNSIY